MTDEREEIARIIDRLESSDPDFNDCTDAANILRAILARDEGRRGVVGGDWVLVPRDDDARQFSDTALPMEMVDAGIEVLDRVHLDLAGHNGKDAPDWDDGMVAVAVYRAMLAAAPSPPVADKPSGVTLTKAEADLARQWFNAVQDTSPSYLGPADAALGLKLHEALGVYAAEELRCLAQGKRPHCPDCGTELRASTWANITGCACPPL